MPATRRIVTVLAIALPAALLAAVGWLAREQWARIRELEGQLAAEREQSARIRELEGQLAVKDEESESLGKAIEEQKSEMAKLRAKNGKLTEERSVLQTRLLSVQKERARLAADVKFLDACLLALKEGHPEIHRRLIRGFGGIHNEKPIRGKVTAIDKKLGLVIINAGQRQDVERSDLFTVLRRRKVVGTIRVAETFPDSSAAFYVRKKMKGDVEVGDDVTTLAPIDEF